MSSEGKTKLKEIFTCWLSSSLPNEQFSRERSINLPYCNWVNYLNPVRKLSIVLKSFKSFKKLGVKFYHIFFELKFLKETLGDFLSICSGNSFMSSLLSK